jgi:hypothetical protein
MESQKIPCFHTTKQHRESECPCQHAASQGAAHRSAVCVDRAAAQPAPDSGSAVGWSPGGPIDRSFPVDQVDQIPGSHPGSHVEFRKEYQLRFYDDFLVYSYNL